MFIFHGHRPVGLQSGVEPGEAHAGRLEPGEPVVSVKGLLVGVPGAAEADVGVSDPVRSSS